MFKPLRFKSSNEFRLFILRYSRSVYFSMASLSTPAAKLVAVFAMAFVGSILENPASY